MKAGRAGLVYTSAYRSRAGLTRFFTRRLTAAPPAHMREALTDAHQPRQPAILSLAEALNDYYLFWAAEGAVSFAVLNNLAAHHFADPG